MKKIILILIGLFLLNIGFSQEIIINTIKQDSCIQLKINKPTPIEEKLNFAPQKVERFNDKKLTVPYEAVIGKAPIKARLMSKPSVVSSLIDTCQVGTKVKVLEKTNHIFRKIAINDTIGYISIVFLRNKEKK